MNIFTDLRLAARLLLRDPAFALTATGALTLGMAANILVFTLVNGLLWRDLPFTDPDRLVALKSYDTAGGNEWNLSYPDFRDLQASSSRTLDGIAGVDQSAMHVVDESRNATRRTGAYVSAGMFRLLDQRPQLGRDFDATDDRVGSTPVVILGHALWQQGFGGSPDVLGRSIRVDGTTATVVGVMPEGFGFPEVAELWQPLAMVPATLRQRRDVRSLTAIGRLAAGAEPERATTELAAIMAGLARQYPETNASLTMGLIPYREEVVGRRAVEMFSVLLGAVAVLLLLACANVANLLLARSARRAREISIRASMGASRWRIVRQLLVESLVLSVVAGAVGLVLGAVAARAFAAAFTNLAAPFWLAFPVDGRVVVFVAMACLGTTVVFGLLPALQASKTNVGDVLGDASRTSAGSVRTQRWSGGLIVLQVALALVLLSAGGLILRSALDRYQRDPGIETSGLLTMRIELPAARYSTAALKTDFYRQLDDRLAALPGIRAAIATPAPRMGGPERWLAVEGSPVDDGRRRPRVTTVAVGARYFETLGLAIRQGRDFTALDGAPGRGSVIVNERFASLFLPPGPAVGRRIELGPDGPDIGATGWLTIVGVVPNVRQNEEEESPFDPVAYLPYAAFPLPNAMLIARSTLAVAPVAGAIRDTVRDLDVDLALFEIATLDDAVAADLWPLRIFGTMFGTFGIAALLLAALGLYAMTAYAAAQRTREIGVRIALGARAPHVWWAVCGRLSIQLGAGVGIGLAGALAAGQVVQGILGGVSGSDPATLTAVSLLLVAVAFVACLLPARRSMRLNPVDALRAE